MRTIPAKTDVLVVGAGPCGLVTGLVLARAGLAVELIDRAWKTSGESFACGIHPETLDVFETLGIAQAAVEAGSRAESVAYYDQAKRVATLHFEHRQGRAHDALLILPQDRLEELLEERLLQLGHRVRWGHRLDTFRQDDEGVHTVVEEIGLTSIGYPFARTEEAVTHVREVRAKYLVGTDGISSHVRQILEIPCEPAAPPSIYDMVEFKPVTDAGREVRISINPGTVDAFWPQPGWTCRWSLERPSSAQAEPRGDGGIRGELPEAVSAAAALAEQIRTRAPWFEAGVREIEWQSQVTFERKMARSFGRGRAWLAGDAGHQTSPIGMQSLNVGLREASDLAHRIVALLRNEASADTLLAYAQERRDEWQGLLGVGHTLKATAAASDWARGLGKRLLGTLPGSGAGLQALASELGLEAA